MKKVILLICIVLLIVFLFIVPSKDKKDFNETDYKITQTTTTTLQTTTTTIVEKSNQTIPIRFFMDVDGGKDMMYFDNYTIADVRIALKIWEEKTKIIEFIEVGNEKVADIIIRWSSNLTKVTGVKTVGEAWYREGEMGGTIYLLPSGMSCRNQLRTLHEIGHLFGLNHSTNYMSMMYRYESCLQNITDEDVKEVVKIFGK